MKIALTTEGTDLDAAVSGRFARTPYFLIVDHATMEYQAVENTSPLDVSTGLGLRAAWIVVNRHASMVITGRLGSNARRILEQHDVRIVTGADGMTAREAVSRYGKDVTR